jgi:DNA-binding CsgD family transcriptional regulator
MLDENPNWQTTSPIPSHRAGFLSTSVAAAPEALAGHDHLAPPELRIVPDVRLSPPAGIAYDPIEAEAAQPMQLLSWMKTPAILIDRTGSIIDANRQAVDLLRHDPLLRSRKLMAKDRCSNERLQEFVRSAFDSGDSQAQRLRTIIVRHDRRPLLVALVWRQPCLDPAALDLAILALIDTDDRPDPDQTILRTAFDLTASEARLAAHIASGGSLEDGAAKFGIARGTVAKQLKSIFGKTDTHRQGELVSLLARFAF